ncbi:MAG: hypothetical protein ACJ790_08530 [Myxococcaceae bacterium]
MTEREALTLSGIALLVALLSALWFERSNWPGAGVLGLLFATWAVVILVRHVNTSSEEDL